MSALAIRIQDLKFRYPGQGDLTLDIKNLEIAKGQTTFLQGPSGSGKSTLLNILSGVLPFENGQVEVLGKNLKSLSPSQKDLFRADHMGFIFQMFNLVPYLTVAENVLLPLQFSKEKKKHIKERTEELASLFDSLKIPKNYLNKKVTELSVGQQQRVAVARALIGKPEIIIADEPTSSLDFEARDSFLKLLFDQVAKTKSTLIFVSHDTSLKTYFHSFIELKTVNKAYRDISL